MLGYENKVLYQVSSFYYPGHFIDGGLLSNMVVLVIVWIEPRCLHAALGGSGDVASVGLFDVVDQREVANSLLVDARDVEHPLTDFHGDHRHPETMAGDGTFPVSANHSPALDVLTVHKDVNWRFHVSKPPSGISILWSC